jgi:hypothetical protein
MNSPFQLKMSSRVTAATLLVFFFSVSALFSAEPANTDDPEELKKIIEAQQAQLEAQQKTLQELLQRVEALTSDSGQLSEPSGDQAAPVTTAVTVKDGAEPEWPGSFSLFGSKTRLAVGGNLGNLLGTIVAVVFANLWARKTRRPTSIVLVPASVLLVSGSIGFRGMAALAAGQTAVGEQQFLQMFVVALTIAVGLLIGNTITKPEATL